LGDPFVESPPEPETNGDLDAAFENDAESVVDELVFMEDDGGPPTLPDAGNPLGPTDAGNPVEPLDASNPSGPTVTCVFAATPGGDTLHELDAPEGSTTRLRFEVAGLPPAPDVTAAVLRFDSFDANRRGLEGRIDINGRGSLDLPADPAWENNLRANNTVDVRPFVQAGSNIIEFGPGPIGRSVYRIGRVSMTVTMLGTVCPNTMTGQPDGGTLDGGTGTAGVRRIRYDGAEYIRRFNWVHRCASNYAYTARGASHARHDCGMMYAPDGTFRGTATFRFRDVVPGMYDIRIVSRHAPSRNARGALFIVNGERRRIRQNDTRGAPNLVTDTWGRRMLGGTVTVVLNANSAAGSDSVAQVVLRPVR